MTNKTKLSINEEYFLESISTHKKILDKFEQTAFPVIKKIVESVLLCYQNHAKILLAGNGGSAADCQHIAGELVGRFKLERKPLAAISLVTDTSVLSGISNDYDYESVFARQIEAIGAQHDILWVFSTSGTSENIIKAARMARNKKIKVIAFTGKPHSQLEEQSDICLCAYTEDAGQAQEIHQLAYHVICKYIDHFHSSNSLR